MNNILTFCDIPVADIDRAKAFYSEVLGVSFVDETMDGMLMFIMASEPGSVSGALVQADGYVPSQTGTVVYLNGGDNLDESLVRAEKAGAEVLLPKTAIKDGAMGYFAQITDSEGNRIGLYSQP